MPIQVFQDDENEMLIRSVFTDDWDWLAFDAATRQIISLASSVDFPVDLITDLSNSSTFPPGEALPYILRLRKNRPRNLRSIIVVNPGAEVTSYITMANRLDKTAHQLSYRVKTLEEAYQIIENRSQAD